MTLQDSRADGFTLVELMIAVGIIGILASIALPTFNGYIRKARSSEANSVITRALAGAQAYFDTEYITQGTTGTAYNGCIVTNTFEVVPAFPREVSVKKIGDFSAISDWRALGVTMNEPMSFSYFVGSTASTDIASNCLPGSVGSTYSFAAVSPFKETSPGNAMFEVLMTNAPVTTDGVQKQGGLIRLEVENSLASFFPEE